jgi:predicted phage terminase large subunit-like protein
MMNRDVQRIIDSQRYRNVFPDVRLNDKNIRADASGSYLRNNDIFEIVDHEGTYRSAGIGGGITGMGALLGIIDDPYKHRKDADSPAWRTTVQDWYSSTFYTRLDDPSAAIVIMMTRWHDDDLLGWLFELERTNPKADRWLLINFPAILDEIPDPVTAPKHFEAYTKFEQRTELDTVLWAEKYPRERLEAMRANNPADFEALQQQRPVKPGGGMFPREKFKTIPYDEFLVFEDMLFVRSWDKAGTEGGGAFSAGVLMCFDPQARYGVHFIVCDVQRVQYEALAREKLIRTTAGVDRGRYGFIATFVEQEPASGGKESAQNTVRVTLAGFEVYAEPAAGEGNKEARARPFSIQVKAGNVALVEGEWNEPYLNELTRFPAGKYKDQTDASAISFNKLSLGWDQEYTVTYEEPLVISPF